MEEKNLEGKKYDEVYPVIVTRDKDGIIEYEDLIFRIKHKMSKSEFLKKFTPHVDTEFEKRVKAIGFDKAVEEGFKEELSKMSDKEKVDFFIDFNLSNK